MRFVQYIRDGLEAAGIPFTYRDGSFRLSDRVSIHAEPRSVSVMTVIHSSPRREVTDHGGMRFTGRKWRRDLIAYALEELR